uniref:Beta-defensin-like domain-containing protein n=1 Tax=Strix occidentalis caurina TaxID=311401 RepID=A0A8D0KVQ2_STROC
MHEECQPFCNHTLLAQIITVIVWCVSFPTKTGSVIGCRLRWGFCAPGRCPLNSRPIGRCSTFQACCKR